MAIATTPLFNQISGSAGPVDFRTRRNGKIEIGKKRIPSNPQSTRQLEVRAGYGRLHELWQNASYIDKAQYERLGQLYNVSAWNAFLMRHQSAMSAAPVASWSMAESSGLDLHDLTTNKINGTIYGAVWDTTGPADLSILSYDGIDDFVNCGTNPLLNFTTQNFTLSEWIYLNTPHSPTTFQRGKVNLDGYYTRIEPNGLVRWMFNQLGSNHRTQTSAGEIKIQKWYNIIYSRDGNNCYIFINGQDKTTIQPVMPSPTSSGRNLELGRYGPTDHVLNGFQALPAAYDRRFSEPDALQYYNNTKHLFGVYP